MLTNGDFIGRVRVAVLTAASMIAQEDGYDRENPSTPRHRLAAQVALDSQVSLDAFVRACALNLAIAADEEKEPNSSKDGGLQYVVNANWDAVAEMAAPVSVAR